MCFRHLCLCTSYYTSTICLNTVKTRLEHCRKYSYLMKHNLLNVSSIKQRVRCKDTFWSMFLAVTKSFLPLACCLQKIDQIWWNWLTPINHAELVLTLCWPEQICWSLCFARFKIKMDDRLALYGGPLLSPYLLMRSTEKSLFPLYSLLNTCWIFSPRSKVKHLFIKFPDIIFDTCGSI